MLAVASAPPLLGLTGWTYGVPAIALSLLFLGLATRVGFRSESDPRKMKPEKQLFAFSIIYLFAMFGALVADRLIAAGLFA